MEAGTIGLVLDRGEIQKDRPGIDGIDGDWLRSKLLRTKFSNTAHEQNNRRGDWLRTEFSRTAYKTYPALTLPLALCQ